MKIYFLFQFFFLLKTVSLCELYAQLYLPIVNIWIVDDVLVLGNPSDFAQKKKKLIGFETNSCKTAYFVYVTTCMNDKNYPMSINY